MRVAGGVLDPKSQAKEIQRQFAELAAQWQAQTVALSSTTARAMHPSYQRIIGLGPAAVPLLLQDLEKTENHWFWALKAITGSDPVAAEDRGNVTRMAEAWIRWGREHGYSW